MITQENFTCQMANVENSSVQMFPGKEVVLSYLPLAHVAERLMYFGCFTWGGKIAAFPDPDKKNLTKALAIVKPTLFLSVPRLFNKFYAIMQAKIKPPALTGCKLCLINRAISVKNENISNKNDYKHAVYDVLLKKMRMVLGGRVRIMLTGSAPIEAEVKQFFKIVIGAPMIEAYGQTECGGICTFVDKDDPTNGHVGGCIVSNEIKLQDVPEMNYLSTDKNENGVSTPRGEVLLRGYNVSPGYYKMPEKTAETFKDGWLHTGDIGMILPSGALKIIDRRKNIFKLSQGEYVAPEKVEGVYKLLP